MLRKISDVVFKQDQPWPPARDVEAPQHFNFMTFDIDRQEIEGDRRARFPKDCVESTHRDIDDTCRRASGSHALSIERRQWPGNMQRHCPAGIVRRRTCNRKNLGLSPASKFVRKIWLGFDENPVPTGLLEVPGLRTPLRLVGANFDEIALALAEECGNQPHLMIGRNIGHGRISQRDDRAFGSRVRSTMEVVEWPGTRSIKTTSPPSASTISRPTTCSCV